MEPAYDVGRHLMTQLCGTCGNVLSTSDSCGTSDVGLTSRALPTNESVCAMVAASLRRGNGATAYVMRTFHRNCPLT